MKRKRLQRWYSRIAQRPSLAGKPGAQPVDPARPSLMLVSPSAEGGDTTELALNLCQGYAHSHNVVVVLLHGGAWETGFSAAACGILMPGDRNVDSQYLHEALVSLTGQPWPALAIVIGIECRGLLAPLFALSIPSIALLHEFPAFTRPRTASTEVFVWADQIVFSSEALRRDTLATGAPGGHPPTHVLRPGWPHEGPIAAPTDGLLHRCTSLGKVLDATSPRLILGAGAIGPRAGLQHFLAVAAALRSQDNLLFVWMGDGYDPENDLHDSALVEQQLHRHGLSERLWILPRCTATWTALVDACTAVLLPAQLEAWSPLAIAAMNASKPVLAFQGATGLAERMAESPFLASLCLCPDLDPQGMARQLQRLLDEPERLATAGLQCRALAAQELNMATYRQELQKLAEQARVTSKAQQTDLEHIVSSAPLDPSFLANVKTMDARLLAGLYLRQWQRQIGPRLPVPGFHPAIYAERTQTQGDALCAWLAAGKPEGPWSAAVIRPGHSPSKPAQLSVGLHLHVFYPELLPELLRGLNHNKSHAHLIITIPEGVDQSNVEAILSHFGRHDAELRNTPNRGRDIGALLVDLGLELDHRFEIHGHLHTKRSELVDGGVAERWRHFLLANLLGGAHGPMLDSILNAFVASPQLGIVFPEDPNTLGWAANRAHAESFAQKLHLPQPLPTAFRFPAGNMFWARRGALRRLYALGLSFNDLPAEPLGYDGTLLHAMERLLPFVVEQAGLRIAVTHVPGVNR